MAKETGRDKKEAFKVLLNMTEQGIGWSTKPEYFEDFVLFFEAVIGFFKGK
jgi:CRISPR/Cas system CSM-associated protein Csm2 small subunit